MTGVTHASLARLARGQLGGAGGTRAGNQSRNPNRKGHCMHLSSRIRTARRLKGWSQAALAAALVVDRSAVGHWERGTGSAPSTRRLAVIATVTGVSVEWLLTGTGPMVVDHMSGQAASLPVPDREEERWRRCFGRLTEQDRRFFLELAESRTIGR